jgi:hypothetical protein
LPYTLQWNAAVQQALGNDQTLTLSYVAAGGRKLLHEYYYAVPNNPNFGPGGGALFLMTNDSASSYNSFQAQFQRRLAHGLQALASYTWSHSIDNVSNNQNLYATLLRGNSDFDVRHSFSAALTYDVPGGYASPVLGALLKHWSLDLHQSARSGLPVDIYSGYTYLFNGQYAYTRPDLVPGTPIYLSNSVAPGGRVVNINAFAAATGPIGDEPRNFVRGFSAWQTDLAIRREFPCYTKWADHAPCNSP